MHADKLGERLLASCHENFLVHFAFELDSRVLYSEHTRGRADIKMRIQTRDDCTSEFMWASSIVHAFMDVTISMIPIPITHSRVDDADALRSRGETQTARAG